MTIRTFSIAAAALLLGAAVTPAATKTQSDAEKQAEAPKAASGKKICKSLQTTGSRLGVGQRACHTKEEWKKIQELN